MVGYEILRITESRVWSQFSPRLETIQRVWLIQDWVWFSIWLAVVHIELPCGSIGCGRDQYFMDIFVVEFDSARCSFSFMCSIEWAFDIAHIWIWYGRSNFSCVSNLVGTVVTCYSFQNRWSKVQGGQAQGSMAAACKTNKEKIKFIFTNFMFTSLHF